MTHMMDQGWLSTAGARRGMEAHRAAQGDRNHLEFIKRIRAGTERSKAIAAVGGRLARRAPTPTFQRLVCAFASAHRL